MRYRTKSRLARYQSKRLMKQTGFLIGMSVVILLIVLRFGVPLLIKLAVVLGDMRAKPSGEQIEEVVTLVPPVLQPLPEATFSATIKLSGFAKENENVVVFLNSNPLEDITADSQGEFETELDLRQGDNRVWAIVRQGDKESSKSQEMTIIWDSETPEITIDAPEDNSTVTDDSLEVRGIVSEEVYLTINGRLVSQKNDLSFSTTLTLQEGENKLTIFAKDLAGNTTNKELKVVYEP